MLTPPHRWVHTLGKVVFQSHHETGGHFPAWETPDMLLEDIWAFFGNEALSNTGVFAQELVPDL